MAAGQSTKVGTGAKGTPGQNKAGTIAGLKRGRSANAAHGARSKARPKTSVARGESLWQRVFPGKRRVYEALNGTTNLERDAAVRTGAPAAVYSYLAEDMGVPLGTVVNTLGVARATVDRKIRRQATLNVAETEGVLDLAQLVAQVQSIVDESGVPQGFDAARWTASWLAEPHPALGGRRPREYMSTAPGREAVSHLLAQMQSGAYA